MTSHIRKTPSSDKNISFISLGNQDHKFWIDKFDIPLCDMAGNNKTITLQSLGYNALAMGNEFIHTSPDGNPTPIQEAFVMARRFSREDDFLVLDFLHDDIYFEKSIQGTIKRYGPGRISNTFNPFSHSSANAIINILASFLPKTDDDNAAAIFQKKALALMTSLIPVLVKLRDAKVSLSLTDMSNVRGIYRPKGKLGCTMSIMTIRDYLEPAACVFLVFPMKHDGSPEECDEVAKYVDQETLDTLKQTLIELQYQPDGPEVLKQRSYIEDSGYARYYFGSILSLISSLYKRLFGEENSEVDFHDILSSQRILVEVSPNPEKNPQDYGINAQANYGINALVLASLKNEMKSTITKSSIAIVDKYNDIATPHFRINRFLAINKDTDYISKNIDFWLAKSKNNN